MKKKAIDTQYSTRIILADSMEALSQGGMVAIPGRNVQRWWQVNENAPSIPTSFDFDIPEDYQQIKIGEREHQFLLYDSGIGDSERILIFGTMDGIRTLEKSETWATDGMFKSCPEIFFQFLNVHVVNKNMYISRIFALLPIKREDTYGRFHAALGNLGKFDPKIFF